MDFQLALSNFMKKYRIFFKNHQKQGNKTLFYIVKCIFLRFGGVFQKLQKFHSFFAAAAAHFARWLQRCTDCRTVGMREDPAAHIFVQIYTRYPGRFAVGHTRYRAAYGGCYTAGSAFFSANYRRCFHDLDMVDLIFI